MNNKFYIKSYNNNSYLEFYQFNEVRLFKAIQKSKISRAYNFINNSNISEDCKFWKSYNSNRISLLNSRKAIREYSLNNDFRWFFTVTFDEKKIDRFNEKEIVIQFDKYLKSIKRIEKEFIYLYVVEKHKNGAFHIHGLTNICNNMISFDYLSKYIKVPNKLCNCNFYLDLEIYKRFGFCSFEPIRNKIKCSNYITKYISKNIFYVGKNKIRYHCSKGLKRCEKSIEFWDKKLLDMICPKFLKKDSRGEVVKLCYTLDLNSLSDYAKFLLYGYMLGGSIVDKKNSS